MRRRLVHDWDVDTRQARAIQEQLRDHVISEDDIGPVRKVAGTDVGFEDAGRVVRAAVAVLSFPALQLLESNIARVPTRFPYIPGLLSFREIPGLLAALEGLQQSPDLLLADGQGYAHPRRFGLACHLGVLTGLPSIGVAKTRLLGSYCEPDEAKASSSPLYDGEEIIGRVLRTRHGVKPVFVSVGHRVCLATAVAYTLACTTRYRLPETTRWAHRLASG